MADPSAAVVVHGLSKRYRSGLLANDGIDLEVRAGEVFGLLGPNGAGKTTLVGQLLGLVRPSAGSIRLAGVDVVVDPGAAARLASYQPQGAVPITGLRPLDAIRLTGRLRGGPPAAVDRRARELVAALDLEEWATRTRPLSGGVARLVGFCMAAVVPGRVVVLDEPTNDVDPLRRRHLWRLVRELADAGSAILLVTHNVLEAERCVDRLAILAQGRVAASGSPAQLGAGLDGRLRLELALEPGVELEPPPCLEGPVRAGTRVVAAVRPGALTAAVAWAEEARSRRVVTGFSLVPASLEDVYLRAVGSGAAELQPDHQALTA